MSTSEAIAAPDPETAALDHLEERIRRAVELVAALRAERDAALADAESARRTAAAALAEAERLRQQAAGAEALRSELEGLRSQRKQVRVRIEKLLGQMDLLSGQ
jgi:FtsZ-binding cell division protein ZapB